MLYLFVLIPGFAALYFLPAHGFTQTTVEAERNLLAADRSRVADLVDAELVRIARARHGSSTVVLRGGWHTDLEQSCTLSSMRHAEGGLDFEVTCAAVKNIETEIQPGLTVPVAPAVTGFTAHLAGVGRRTDDGFVHVVSTRPSATPPEADSPVLDPGLFFTQTPAGYFRGVGDGTTSVLPPSASAEVTRLHKALEGDPLALPGRMWRMLYFSAVTATTLGYGDIVPVTHASRSLVALETVLGIVVAGLFVNSAAGRRGSIDRRHKRRR